MHLNSNTVTSSQITDLIFHTPEGNNAYLLPQAYNLVKIANSKMNYTSMYIYEEKDVRLYLIWMWIYFISDKKEQHPPHQEL